MTARAAPRLISVLGTSGTGKSRLVGRLVDALVSRGLPARAAYLGRAREPDWMAPARRLLERWAGADSETAAGPQTSTSDRRAGRLLRAAAAWWYVAGYVVHDQRVVRPALRRGDVLVADRGVDDLAVMPGAPRAAWRVATRLTRTPDLLVVLEAPVPILRRRRTTRSAPDLRREAAAYRSIAGKRADTGMPVRFVVADEDGTWDDTIERELVRSVADGWSATRDHARPRYGPTGPETPPA